MHNIYGLDNFEYHYCAKFWAKVTVPKQLLYLVSNSVAYVVIVDENATR